jgi:predicted phosphodiesterase
LLAALPFRIDIRSDGGHVDGPTVTLLHGNQTLNTVYVTADRSDAFLAKMGDAVGARPGDVVCFGHTHVAFHRIVGDVHFVNTGSVGRPKDGDARAGFVVLALDAGAVAVDFKRVAYDVERVATGILASDLPHEFADFLRLGGKVRRQEIAQA